MATLHLPWVSTKKLTPDRSLNQVIGEDFPKGESHTPRHDPWGLIAARPKGVRTPIRKPKKNGVQPLHAASERRAEAARHLQAFNRRAYGVRPCQTGVQSLHACRLTTNCVAHVSLSNQEAYVSQPRPVPLELTWARVQKPATKFNHPDPQANDRPCLTDTHQTQPSR
ncbi:hypothetical protein PCANC_10273 [Puccinia coronata f. sp. avenae]|uniref:Uncharacterized protein n=1 Tax=Puccinia coronata f. sp. avenae TaxID=200324 RepID=A0A2N5VQH5_9BASI|nr:hypothetical protein PCANC_10273 [Puccinia coronata f. sp. avenae]